MTNSEPNVEDQTSEMTDEARQVIKKARRSFGFSMIILILGLIAVMLALVYRVTREDNSLPARFALDVIELPAGARVTSIVPFEDNLAVTFSVAGQSMLHILDGETGEVLREIPISAPETSPE